MRATLKITNAQFADTGLYKCTVSVPPNKSDYKLTKIEVKAPSAPKISPYTEQTEILEGSTKAIKCVAEGYPKPTVDWYRNGKKMNVTNCHSNPQSCDKVDYEVYEEGDGSSGLHTIYTVQVLKIRSALYPRDVGEFKCVASNGVSSDAELSVSLDVQVKPTLKERLVAVAVVEGKEAEVSCTVTKSNPLPTFSWQYAFKNLECDIQQPTGTCVPKENKWITVPSQLVFPSSSTPTNESIVNVAKDQQNAFYRCQAFNSLGNDSQILRFVRLVKPDPMVEIDTGKTMTEVNEKSTLQVFCIDRMDGDWGLLFSKDGEKIELSDPRVNVTIFENQPKETERLFKLTIKNVTMNDTGEYGCTLSVLFPKLLDAINVTVKGERAKV
ncbi:Roundabout 1 [Porites harrisoni]